ncbi:uncharacterized protein LOC126984199 [Eriocheir sinensis]|uniref:uncharacterized protein LOC126984199 n=1 Tax=Eriocheir sinensis TaxID=95602 RepID=UPI0021C5DD49|nr:uncharacterized protein LOC126984199 [Eriocheir sinensis]
MADNSGAKSSNPLEQLVTRLTPKMSGRMMKYPYTFSAKLAQFPLQHYVKNVWVVKYYIFGVGLSIPVFSWIQKMACSPENVAKFAKKDH